jgi:hypothetical protein
MGAAACLSAPDNPQVNQPSNRQRAIPNRAVSGFPGMEKNLYRKGTFSVFCLFAER